MRRRTDELEEPGGMSYAAMNRIVEDRMSSDKDYREEVESSGRPLLSQGRRMTSEELFAKLSSFGLDLNEKTVKKLAMRFLSAQEISEFLLERSRSLRFHDRFDEDWVWICAAVVWERCLPDRPSMEMIDDGMQDGYSKQDSEGDVAACEAWLRVWRDITRIMDERGMKSLAQFDAAFQGTQSASNWWWDLDTALINAGRKDGRYHRRRIAFCQDLADRFSIVDPELAVRAKDAIAEAFLELGEIEESDARYRKLVEENPGYGWGWIHWSDCYNPDNILPKDHSTPEDLAKAERILKRALEVEGVSDRQDILERLADICEATGRKADAGKIRKSGRERG